MSRQSHFPLCVVPGSREPVTLQHLDRTTRIPAKCDQCNHMFEGGCLRAGGHDYKELDYGPCPMRGSTEPSAPREHPKWYPELRVPLKCRDCRYLQMESNGFRCSWQAERWASGLRPLDWVGFETPFDHVEGLDWVVPLTLIVALEQKGIAASVKLVREHNPTLPITRARALCQAILDQLSPSS